MHWPALWILFVATACSSDKPSKQPPSGETGSATRPKGDVAVSAKALAVGSAATGPALGPPPAGMDAAQAAACDRGEAAGCVAAAKSYAPQGAYRVTLPKEEADQREQGTALYAKRACELGNGEGCALVAQFDKDLPRKGYDASVARACELGYMASCGSIGRSALDMATTPDERKAAAAMLEKACLATQLIGWR